MTEVQYRFLCAACDGVLLAPDSTIERVSIAWLHVVREHPVFLKNYADVFEPRGGIRMLTKRWLRSVRIRLGWWRQLASALRSDGSLWHGSEELPGTADVVFVSHLLNASQVDQDDDFYFGDLPHQLALQHRSPLILLINHSGKPAVFFAGRWKRKAVPRLVFSDSLGTSGELGIWFRLRKEARRLKRMAKQERSGTVRRVLARAAEEALSNASLQIMRMAEQVYALVAKLQPKAIVVTHEGHAWERVVFAAARRARFNVQCIGYQHAALFRLQHSIQRSLTSEYNPDRILAAGAVGKAQLERAPGLKGIPVSVAGSIRNANARRVQAQQDDAPVCLVLPEGISGECHRLFEFSLRCAQACPEIRFVWRLHPIVDYQMLIRQNAKLKNRPGNVALSQRTFEEDIAGSRWALYRGTTAVIPAVGAGSRPIYLQVNDEMTVDPLYELDQWRVNVGDVRAFQRVVEEDIKASASALEAEWQPAKFYCETFFLPFNRQALIDAIG